jgi:hypothetical protein
MVATDTAADKFDAITVIKAPIARSHKNAFSDLPESAEDVKRCQFWREIGLRRRSVQSYA